MTESELNDVLKEDFDISIVTSKMKVYYYKGRGDIEIVCDGDYYLRITTPLRREILRPLFYKDSRKTTITKDEFYRIIDKYISDVRDMKLEKIEELVEKIKMEEKELLYTKHTIRENDDGNMKTEPVYLLMTRKNTTVYNFPKPFYVRMKGIPKIDNLRDAMKDKFGVETVIYSVQKLDPLFDYIPHEKEIWYYEETPVYKDEKSEIEVLKERISYLESKLAEKE